MVNRPDQRKSGRAENLIPTRVNLKGAEFAVRDISSGGMGIVLEDGGPQFFMGERLEEIPIPLSTGTVVVHGVVSHLSINDTGRICGIRFLFSGDEYEAVIQFKKERMVPAQ